MNLVQYIHPTNLDQERSKFFDSNTYNPQFDYNWSSPQALELREKKKRFKKLFAALDKQRPGEITSVCAELFETQITEQILDIARKLTKDMPIVVHKGDFNDVKSAFERAFEYFSLDFEVEVVDKGGFNARPRVNYKKILISKYVNLDLISIEGLVAHEMVHIIRSINSKFNQIRKSDAYLPTEEGLASFVQDYYFNENNYSLFQHAAEYLGTEIALKGTFRELFNYLVDLGFTKELSWQRAVRHKFGFKDTTLPGDIMKPSMYFYHEMKIRELSIDELIRLFVGNISLSELSNYPIYTGAVSERKLREFFRI